MNKKFLKGIYAITPNDLDEEVLLKKVTDLLKGGIKLVQYRDKFRDRKDKLKISLKLKEICDYFDSFLIINDDPLLTKQVSANGVHLGQEDMPYKEARNILGPEAIIGISCHNNIDLALKAESQGADYVAFGSLFNTKTKNRVIKSSIDEIELLVSKVKIPTVVIGGLNLSNLNQLLSSKANMFAISSGLFDEEDSSATASVFIKNLKS